MIYSYYIDFNVILIVSVYTDVRFLCRFVNLVCIFYRRPYWAPRVDFDACLVRVRCICQGPLYLSAPSVFVSVLCICQGPLYLSGSAIFVRVLCICQGPLYFEALKFDGSVDKKITMKVLSSGADMTLKDEVKSSAVAPR